MDIDEKQVVELLRKKNLNVEEFSKREKEQSKTPDFRVFKKNELVFFCEVKTIASDEWLENIISKAPSGQIVGGGRKDPRYNRLSNKIHDAVQQFEAVNPNLEYPNVLAFVNHDRSCGWLDLIAITTGHFLAKGGTIHPIYIKYSEGRIKEEKFKIDLYIWKDESKKESYLFNQHMKKHLENLCNYFGINPDSIENILVSHQRRK